MKQLHQSTQTTTGLYYIIFFMSKEKSRILVIIETYFTNIN